MRLLRNCSPVREEENNIIYAYMRQCGYATGAPTAGMLMRTGCRQDFLFCILSHVLECMYVWVCSNNHGKVHGTRKKITIVLRAG